MRCSEARQQITALAGASPPASLQAHLRVCDLCRQLCEDRLLDNALNALCIPGPQKGFVERSIARAIEANRAAVREIAAGTGRGARGWSLAATLVLGVFIGFWLNSHWRVPIAPEGVSAEQPQTNANALVAAAAAEGPTVGPAIALLVNQVKAVNVVIDSVADQDEATIHIALAGNIEIDGYPGSRELRWNTRLLRGKNLLTLPLILQTAADGYLDVSYSAGSDVHRLRIPVNARPQAVAPPASI